MWRTHRTRQSDMILPGEAPVDYQRKAEWVGLAEQTGIRSSSSAPWRLSRRSCRTPGLAGDADFGDQAMRGRNYTWSGGESLPQLHARRDEILRKHRDALAHSRRSRQNVPLLESLADALDEDDDTTPCTVCAL